MTYKRTIPRDLFNEGNLLKCYGQLWLHLENRLGPKIQFDFEDFDGQAFEIVQNPADGSTYIANVSLFIKGRRIRLSRPLNSREPWPLYAAHPDKNDVEIEVFDEGGLLSLAFKRMLP